MGSYMTTVHHLLAWSIRLGYNWAMRSTHSKLNAPIHPLDAAVSVNCAKGRGKLEWCSSIANQRKRPGCSCQSKWTRGESLYWTCGRGYQLFMQLLSLRRDPKEQIQKSLIDGLIDLTCSHLVLYSHIGFGWGQETQKLLLWQLSRLWATWSHWSQLVTSGHWLSHLSPIMFINSF